MSHLPRTSDDGAAVVEFVLVGAFILIPLFLGILQLALVLHARNIVVASAAAGARFGASADSSAAAGAADACRRIRASLQRADQLTCVPDYVSAAGGDGPELVEVRVDGRVPMFFLPWGSPQLSIRAHAVREVPPQ